MFGTRHVCTNTGIPLAKAFDKARRSGRNDLRIIHLRRDNSSGPLAAEQHSTQEDAREMYNRFVYKMRLKSRRNKGTKGDLSRNDNKLELSLVPGRAVVVDNNQDGANRCSLRVGLHQTRSERIWKDPFS